MKSNQIRVTTFSVTCQENLVLNLSKFYEASGTTPNYTTTWFLGAVTAVTYGLSTGICCGRKKCLQYFIEFIRILRHYCMTSIFYMYRPSIGYF